MFLIVFECSVVFIHFDFPRIGYTRFVSLNLKRFFWTLHSKNLKDVEFPFSCFTASLLIAQGFPPDNPDTADLQDPHGHTNMMRI